MRTLAPALCLVLIQSLAIARKRGAGILQLPPPANEARARRAYLASGRTGAGSRVAYAVESSFLARKPDGTRRLSYSRLGGYFAVAFISREWQPHSTNGAQNAATSFKTTLGSEVSFHITREFLPETLPPPPEVRLVGG